MDWKEKKVVVIRLDGQDYGVDVFHVLSIEKLPAITRVPRTPRFVKGVINLRGEVLPIIDLRERFGMSEIPYGDDHRIVVVQVDEMQVGLVVDEARDVLDLTAEMIENTPDVVGGIAADYLDGMAKWENGVLILLNLTQVLNRRELEELYRAQLEGDAP